MEFKHVRTTELQKVQDRNQKRSTDRPISPGSKRPRFQRQPSPMSDSRTHDMSGMKESYTVNDPWDRVPRLGSHSSTPSSVHVPSQQPGVIDIVEDSIELIQTEPPGKRPGEEERELRKVQSTVGVSVASQRDAPADVRLLVYLVLQMFLVRNLLQIPLHSFLVHPLHQIHPLWKRDPLTISLVSGGASGLGRATVERFTKQGARVVLCDLPSSDGEKVAKQMDNCMFLPADITSEKEVKEVLRATMENYKCLDVLVNCAGIGVARW